MAVYDLSFFQEHHSRNVHNPEMFATIGIFFHIAFANIHYSFILRSKFVDDRRYFPARTTPFCPKIDDNKGIGCQYILQVIVR